MQNVKNILQTFLDYVLYSHSMILQYNTPYPSLPHSYRVFENGNVVCCWRCHLFKSRFDFCGRIIVV